MTLIFKYTESLEPGTPALFSAKSDKIAVNDAEDDYEWETKNTVAVDFIWSMEGTYEQKVFEDDAAKSIYYVSGGAIKNAKKTTIAPFRAFIHGSKIVEEDHNPGGYSAKSVQFVIEDEDGTTTALEFVGEDLVPVQKNGIYNLAGQKVNDNYHGVVIKNGKRVLKK